MPRFPSIPRVTIVVPVGDDLAAFETSLVSVLENRPDDAEIIVAHDGSYDDPFDLGDEVRFVEAPTNRLVDLIAVAAAKARGRFVHVLGDGVRAGENWIAAGLEPFDDPEVGMVAPVVRGDSGTILAAGWHDTTARLAAPVLAGTSRVERRAAAGVRGPYLQASFWRRETIRSLSGRFHGEDAVEASYSYGTLLRRDGWRCVTAAGCELQYDGASFPGDRSTFRRGQRLRTLHLLFHGGNWATALLAAGQAMFAATLRGRGVSEAIGQAAAPGSGAELRSRVRLKMTEPLDREPTVRVHRACRTGAGEKRRAA